ncbi:hypothetical protein DRQ53_02860 [bacterium]|nr:MAG: hypothetical protein DRQ53_02860 [bacterium]
MTVRGRHVMLQGLALRHVGDEGLAVLREFRPSQVARLECSFPASPAVVEATLRTGFPPSGHGLLFAHDELLRPDRIGDLHTRIDAAGDPGSALRALLESHQESELLLVSGAPPQAHGLRALQIDDTNLAEAGFTLTVDESFALCAPTTQGKELPLQFIERWLDTPGIERVLAPTQESAGSWMAPPDRGWILVAEAGYHFGTGSRATGHRRAQGNQAAVLLAFGPAWARDWPDTVHDWRVAPTLLAAIGQPVQGFFDRPLPTTEQLRG